MFLKSEKPVLAGVGVITAVAQPPAERPLAATSSRPNSKVEAGITITGDVWGEGELHLDCVIKGDVKVGKLVLGPNGRMDGAVHAQAVEVHGRLTGAIAANAVRLHGTARVDGDIMHEQLAMEPGAEFLGRSLKFQRATTPNGVAFSPPRAEAVSILDQ